ncbi:MAG TPA: branched-chain amino acid ABC transporter permease [Phototrophicaceae bacterium]|jgi:branched-chain amino acid transport system permease protein|nr:branched-chain amino acid ABC transporter permease [Phototrophicaceae bacterium]
MDPLEVFIRQIIIGLTIGSYLALIALGYTLVYGIIELINFAHGDLFAFGFLISLTIFRVLNPPQPMDIGWLLVGLPAVIVLTMVLTGSLNVVIERVAYKPLRRAPRLAPLITAVGVSFMLEALFAYIWGPSQIAYPRFFPNINITKDILHLDSAIRFTTKDLALLGVTIPLMIGLTLFIDRTRLGKAMRAAAQDKEAAAMVGINVNQIIAITFFIGGAMAGAAGTIWGLYINSGRFLMGFEAGLFAFTSAVLGGIGNIRGAVVGAFFIGMVQAMSDQYIGGEWTRIVIFGLLILMLVFRPSGILGSTRQIEKV